MRNNHKCDGLSFKVLLIYPSAKLLLQTGVSCKTRPMPVFLGPRNTRDIPEDMWARAPLTCGCCRGCSYTSKGQPDATRETAPVLALLGPSLCLHVPPLSAQTGNSKAAAVKKEVTPLTGANQSSVLIASRGEEGGPASPWP